MKRTLIVLLAALAAMPLWQGHAAEPAAKPERQVVPIVIYPQPMPRPAMKYRLLPAFQEQYPGNAATQYLRTFLSLAVMKVDGSKHDEWMGISLEKFPREDIRQTLAQFTSILHNVELASRRSECDWGLPIREEENPLMVLLPELHDARNVGRLLALRARLYIAEGKLDEALADLRTGYALARHVAEAPCLINALVGTAIASMMDSQLEALIQTPGAPNLYWALTALPDPPISIRYGFALDGSLLNLTFPESRDLETAQHSPDEWTRILAKTTARLGELLAVAGDSPHPSKTITQAMVIASLPVAKEGLIARGRSRQEVDAMPPAQILLLHIFQTYNEYRDDLFKWFNVPYPQAVEGMRLTEAQLRKPQGLLPDCGQLLPRELLPAIAVCKLTEAKAARRIAELRIIEALRAYAAGHGGKLPTNLADIQDLPLPLNPVTGKAFGYQLDGDTALLTADGPANSQPRQYRLKLAK